MDSFSKSKNEGFIIQKIQSLKSVFRTATFFFLTPYFTLTFTFITHTCHYFFNTNINFIYFYFNYNTPEQRERERERERELRKQNVGLVLAGMGDDDGFQNYCLVVRVEYANLVIATGNSGFRCQFGTVCGGEIQSESKSTTVRFPNIWFFFLIFLIYNIIDCVFIFDGAFLALHVKFRYLVSKVPQSVCLVWNLNSPFSPLVFYFVIL